MKISKYVDRTELATFLRQLADAVENGGTGEFECVDDFRKMKIGVKNEYGKIGLKAKINIPDSCDPPECMVEECTQPKPSYKDLKKRMRSSFKMLVKLIHDGEIPPREAVDSFLKDSALMVTYPGYGDDYYESYTATCETLKAAFDSGDVTRMHKAVDALIHEKSRCHAKYD